MCGFDVLLEHPKEKKICNSCLTVASFGRKLDARIAHHVESETHSKSKTGLHYIRRMNDTLEVMRISAKRQMNDHFKRRVDEYFAITTR